MDIRYELRDTQLFLGKLVDQGLIEPDKIAATGGSYGGGMSLEMAALKDRTMLLDGTLVPWESPEGTPMSLAVASPNSPGASSPTRSRRTATTSTTSRTPATSAASG